MKKFLHSLLHIFDFLLRLFGIFFLIQILAIGYAANWLNKQIPNEASLRECMEAKMFKVQLCPGSDNYVAFDEISSYVVKSIVLTEDSKFFNHKGFDFESIGRNAQEVIESGKYKRGASTITQQLVKNLYLSSEKTLMRKGIEALITWQIERKLTKKEILERYLNVIQFGKNIFGIKAAANFYFKKSAADLNILESAFLAMLLPNPEKYSRSFYKKELTGFAKERIQKIVGDLYQYKRINEAEYRSALKQIDSFLKNGSVLVLEEFKGLNKDTATSAADSSEGLPEEDSSE